MPGGSTPPGGQTQGQQLPGTQGEGNSPGEPSQPTWEPQQAGGAAGAEQTAGQPPGGGETGNATPAGAGGEEESWESGIPGSGSEGGWETSNQLPGGEISRAPPMPSERGLPPGQGTDGSSSGGQGDSELDKALEDFDGEILAERAVIQARSNETAGSTSLPAELPGSSDQVGAPGGAEEAAGYIPQGVPSQNSAQRTPPASGSTGQVPEDLPDARDDDIIARQLREAAMNETDPELQEKLWEEYRRYKGA